MNRDDKKELKKLRREKKRLEQALRAEKKSYRRGVRRSRADVTRELKRESRAARKGIRKNLHQSDKDLKRFRREHGFDAQEAARTGEMLALTAGIAAGILILFKAWTDAPVDPDAPSYGRR